AGDLLEVGDVVDRDASARVLAHLLAAVLEERSDLKPFLAEAGVVGERQTEVPGSHDGDAELLVQSENLTKMPFQIADVIADAADAELAEIREVLANLRGVQVELPGERLRRHSADAGIIELIQAAEID